VNIDVLTLFPSWFGWFTEQRHVRNALSLGHRVEAVDLRATTPLKSGQVDDTPYGGGAGMVIRVDVVEAAMRARYHEEPQEVRSRRRVVALAAGGRQFDDALAAELAAEPEVTLLCGRYEGFDERVNEHLASDVVSIGPYVLSGGELAAMVVCDAVLRRLPGALGHEESAVEESFSPALGGAPEYPHYTRPFGWHGHEVPDVLISGDHGRIREWRLEQSRRRGEQAGAPGFETD
jgi:tRNA (guanine37-N1)-methyltransferase